MPPAERGPGAPVTTCPGLRRNTTHVVKRELKTGAPARGERVAKYNRLLAIAAAVPALRYGMPVG